jgi:hypothetical protein
MSYSSSFKLWNHSEYAARFFLGATWEFLIGRFWVGPVAGVLSFPYNFLSFWIFLCERYSFSWSSLRLSFCCVSLEFWFVVRFRPRDPFVSTDLARADCWILGPTGVALSGDGCRFGMLVEIGMDF